MPLPGLCSSAHRGPRTRGLPPRILRFIWRGSLCTQVKQGSRHLVQDPNSTMGCTSTGAFSHARTSDVFLSHGNPGRGNVCSDGERESSRALKRFPGARALLFPPLQRGPSGPPLRSHPSALLLRRHSAAAESESTEQHSHSAMMQSRVQFNRISLSFTKELPKARGMSSKDVTGHKLCVLSTANPQQGCRSKQSAFHFYAKVLAQARHGT